MASAASTANTTVSVTVASATSLSAAGCASGTANITDFGTVLPATSNVTSADCAVVFGSSNDTSMLRAYQTDTSGSAMFGMSNGSLDTSFDGDGKLTAAVAPGANADDGVSVAVQQDGKIVMAGFCNMGGATGIDFCVERFTTAGALDAGFDGDGRQTVAIAPGTNADNGASVAVQPDGKVVLGGNCDMAGATGVDFCVARYTTAGVLDATFNATGIVTTAIAPATGVDTGASVAVQQDGKVIVVGACAMGGGTGVDFCVARYTTGGVLDTTFDGDGIQTTAVGAGATTDTGRSVALQPDGKIVVAGSCAGGASGTDLCAARYTVAGALDTSFNTTGKVITAIAPGASTDLGISVAVQEDGSIVVVGNCDMGGATGIDFCAARYTSGGALDTSFNATGTVTTSIAPGTGSDKGNGVAVQQDGKVVVVGNCPMGGGTGIDFCATRYTSTGALDSSFDSDGRQTTAISAGLTDNGYAVAMQQDGKIVVGGVCVTGGPTGWDHCLVRYGGGGTVSDWAGSWGAAGLFGACLHTVANASATWTLAGSGNCTTAIDANWNALPTSASKIAWAGSGVTNGTANLRFGFKSTAAQPAGSYIAPLTFEVLAPNA